MSYDFLFSFSYHLRRIALQQMLHGSSIYNIATKLIYTVIKKDIDVQ